MKKIMLSAAALIFTAATTFAQATGSAPKEATASPLHHAMAQNNAKPADKKEEGKKDEKKDAKKKEHHAKGEHKEHKSKEVPKK